MSSRACACARYSGDPYRAGPVEERSDPTAELVRGYAVAVRSALTDDGLPPLDAPGVRLQARLTKIGASLQRVVEKGGDRPN